MRLITLETDGPSVQFHESTGFGTNQVHVFTGQNGSGKSARLGLLANYFGRNVNIDRQYIRWEVDDREFNSGGRDPVRPSRTIAQTYSPYTRFYPSKDPEGSMVDIYAAGTLLQASYVCAGLSRSSRLTGASLSKRVLEQALEGMSSSALHARVASDFFKEAGMGGILHMRYNPLAPLRRIRSSGNVNGAIVEMIELASEGRAFSGRPHPRLVREARQSDKATLAELIFTAVDQIHDLEWYPEGYIFKFDFFEKRSSEFPIFQSLMLLKKLGFMRLVECRLSDRHDYGGLDISTASSGQQQLICSVLSLITTLSDNSLVLIDEPELSLHPKWQQLYFKLLSSTLMPFENCQVVIATHSPLLVQSGVSHGASIIKLDPHTSEVDLNTRDLSVESALIDIFETPIEDSVQLASLVFDAVSNGENAPRAQKKVYLDKLLDLKRIYARQNGGMDQDRKIIDTAIHVLEMD